MRDNEITTLVPGVPVKVLAVVISPPRMAGYPHLDRIEPSATGIGAWVDVGGYQIWMPAATLESAENGL